MRHLIWAFVVSFGLGLAPPLSAADEPSPGSEDPKQLLQESVETFVRALDALIRSIPQYEMPEITEEGDIIIRRRNPVPFDESPGPVPDEPPGEEIPEETDI